jgi:hypothetical protein
MRKNSPTQDVVFLKTPWKFVAVEGMATASDGRRAINITVLRSSEQPDHLRGVQPLAID